MSGLLLLATQTVLSQSSTLVLDGSNGAITFGPSHNRAVLKASCEADEASVAWVSPRTGLSAGSESMITVQFSNVKTTCIDVPIDVPCASEHEGGPKLFTATFTGAASSVTVGPMSPSAVEVLSESGKSLLGIAVRAEVPLPKKSTILAITGFGEMEQGYANVTVSIEYDGKVLPFTGMPLGNMLQNIKMAANPPSTPPPLPPAPPPKPKTYACNTRAAEHPGYTTQKRDGALCGNKYTTSSIQYACAANWKVCTVDEWNARYPKGSSPGGTLTSWGSQQSSRLTDGQWMAGAGASTAYWSCGGSMGTSNCITTGYSPWSHGHYLYSNDGNTIMKGSRGNSWDSTFSPSNSEYMAIYCCWQY